jgi:hypothetical protein
MTPITTPAEAETAIGHLTALIEQLTGIVERETVLVRAGELRKASALEPAKAQLAGQLYVAGERLKTNGKYFLKAAPARCAALAKMQESFRAVLQKNMVVLATAHSVSEGIMRRLSGDLARKASPQIYGATGRATAPNPKHGQPLAVSRSL